MFRGAIELSLFEFNYSLYGLLAGFILIEVLSGFVRTMHARRPTGPGIVADVRIGWLTPMLGVFAMMDIAGFLNNAWVTRNTLPHGYDTFLGGLILCSFYYYAAAMIFPNDPRAWPDLDDWFWLHRRQVLSCILVANLVWIPMLFIYNPGMPVGMLVAVNSLAIGLLIFAAFAPKGWIVMASLALLIVLNLSFMGLEILHRIGVI